MKVEGLVFAGTAVFFAVVAAIYWFTSYEEAGTTMLVLSVFFGLMPAVWLLWWARRMQPRPEDRDADQSEGAGPVGRFPGPTAWPVTLAAGAVLAANGIAFGIWPAVPGFALVVLAACGAIMSGRPRPRHQSDAHPPG